MTEKEYKEKLKVFNENQLIDMISLNRTICQIATYALFDSVCTLVHYVHFHSLPTCIQEIDKKLGAAIEMLYLDLKNEHLRKNKSGDFEADLFEKHSKISEVNKNTIEIIHKAMGGDMAQEVLEEVSKFLDFVFVALAQYNSYMNAVGAYEVLHSRVQKYGLKTKNAYAVYAQGISFKSRYDFTGYISECEKVCMSEINKRLSFRTESFDISPFMGANLQAVVDVLGKNSDKLIIKT